MIDLIHFSLQEIDGLRKPFQLFFHEQCRRNILCLGQQLQVTVARLLGIVQADLQIQVLFGNILSPQAFGLDFTQHGNFSAASRKVLSTRMMVFRVPISLT